MSNYLPIIISILLLTSLVFADGRAVEAFDSSDSHSDSALTTANYSAVPDLEGQYDWSKHYISLFKQAIKEKYRVGDSTLDENLRVIGIAHGKLTDGPETERREGMGAIHYLYKIDWVVYSGTVGFDTIGNTNDEAIVENMKYSLFPIFKIDNIISKDEALSLGLVYQDLREPWYSDWNGLYIEGSENKPSYGKLVFDKTTEIDISNNKCLRQTFSLETGEELSKEQTPCYLEALGQPSIKDDDNKSTTPSLIVGVIVLLVIIIAATVFFFKNKSIVRRSK